MIYLSGGQEEKVVNSTQDSVTDVPSLQSNQEEADTRIILHAVAAANSGANNIVVLSREQMSSSFFFITIKIFMLRKSTFELVNLPT